MKSNVKKIGVIGVDAGLCWIGDPCYILHQDSPPAAIGRDWSDFCAKLTGLHTKLNYDLGHEGLGICVSTGYGDGIYPVYAEFGDEGRIAKVWVDFMPDEDAD